MRVLPTHHFLQRRRALRRRLQPHELVRVGFAGEEHFDRHVCGGCPRVGVAHDAARVSDGVDLEGAAGAAFDHLISKVFDLGRGGGSEMERWGGFRLDMKSMGGGCHLAAVADAVLQQRGHCGLEVPEHVVTRCRFPCRNTHALTACSDSSYQPNTAPETWAACSQAPPPPRAASSAGGPHPQHPRPPLSP